MITRAKATLIPGTIYYQMAPKSTLTRYEFHGFQYAEGTRQILYFNCYDSDDIPFKL